MREASETSDEVVLPETLFSRKAVKSPQNTAGTPSLRPRGNKLLLMDNALTEELRMEGSGEVMLRAASFVELGDPSMVEAIVVKAELRPVNTESAVGSEMVLAKVDRGSMYAGTLLEVPKWELSGGGPRK